MEFLVSYFPLETTAHRDGDLEPKQQVQWAEQWELAEMQMQNLKRECRTKTGSTNCFYSCILTSGCLVQGSLFSRLLNCIPKSSDGHEPWEPATRAYLGRKGEGAWSRLPADPDPCGMLLGWAGRGMISSCPWDVLDVITKACLAFFGTRNLSAQLLGRLRHLC